MGRRVPGLVWVPGIDIEEERPLAVVPLQPARGGAEGLRREMILFPLPLGDDIIAVLPLALPADPDVLLEAAIVAIAIADDEGIIGDATGNVAGVMQDFGQRWLFRPQRPPIAVGEGIAPGSDIGARRHGREGSGVEIIENDAALAESMQVGRDDATPEIGLAGVIGQVIGAQRVGTDEDDVHAFAQFSTILSPRRKTGRESDISGRR